MVWNLLPSCSSSEPSYEGVWNLLPPCSGRIILSEDALESAAFIVRTEKFHLKMEVTDFSET
jgi:hypothetical protein